MPSPHLYLPSLEPRSVVYTWYHKAIINEAADLDKEEREYEASLATIKNNNKKCAIPGWIKHKNRNDDSDDDALDQGDGSEEEDDHDGEDEDDDDEDEIPEVEDEEADDDEAEDEEADEMEDEDDDDLTGTHTQHHLRDLDDEGPMFSDEDLMNPPENSINAIGSSDIISTINPADNDMDLSEHAVFLAMGAEQYTTSHNLDDDF
ncbi:hypothetical protein G9A89_006161 [Geosiphon pyriformis]|nr:hypothetical protein G9A89_006161 [Geosiphon pyriformis]